MTNQNLLLLLLVLGLLWWFFGAGAVAMDFNQLLMLVVFLIAIYFVYMLLTRNSIEALRNNVHYVQISEKIVGGYDPKELYINQGDVVVWTNVGTVDHDVMAMDEYFYSGTMMPTNQFSYKFLKKGRYDYYCTFHPDKMVGVIYVQ